MKRRNLKNYEIDRIGSELLKVAKIGNDEIEKIIENPQLFDSIQARIKADEQLQQEQKRSFEKLPWLKSSFLNRQMMIGVFAVLIVFTIFAALVVVEKQETSQIAREKKIGKPEIRSEIIEFESLSNDSETEFNKDFVSKSEDNERIISKKNSYKSSKPFRKINLAKPQPITAKSSAKPKRVQKQNIVRKESLQIAKKEPQKIFYSLPFAENSETGNENLQLVSTKLSRSELFALGVNIQLENETSTVETELLVGDDGVARAIRVVEKH